MKINPITTIDYKRNYTPSFKGFYNNKALLKTFEFAAKNGTLFSASLSLVLSVLARPIAIMCTPKADKDNKKYASAKALASTLGGYLFMTIASVPVASAMNKIDNSPHKYLSDKSIKYLKNGCSELTKSKTYKCLAQIFKLGLSVLVAYPKSLITCALIPVILSPTTHKKSSNINLSDKKPLGTNVISFKGCYSKLTNTLAKSIAKIMNMPGIQTFAKKFSKTNYEQHLMCTSDIVLTAAFINENNKAKNIDSKYKKMLNVNATISTLLSIIGGYTINSLLNGPTDKFIKKFTKINKNNPKLDTYIEGIKIVKPALILGGIYYIAIPMISTFLAEFTNKNNKEVKYKSI